MDSGRNDAWLILETSGRVGTVAIARGEALVRSATLDSSRRHVRDLASTLGAMLEAEGLRPRHLTGVMVSLGPGSYTGLRVGIMSAKALAYATGCKLVAVPTFEAIAGQSPGEAKNVCVIADALQGHVYVQRFARPELSGVFQPVEELRIELLTDVMRNVDADLWFNGPGVNLVEANLPPGAYAAPAGDRDPRAESLWRVGSRTAALAREEMMTLEPLYLRGSSAEEKAKREGRM